MSSKRKKFPRIPCKKCITYAMCISKKESIIVCPLLHSWCEKREFPNKWNFINKTLKRNRKTRIAAVQKTDSLTQSTSTFIKLPGR